MSVGARIYGAARYGLNGICVGGTTRVARFSHPLPCRPPYSTNHRNAWIGFRSDGALSWSEETTGSGPIVVSGVPETSPKSNMDFNSSNLFSFGSVPGNSPPQPGI